MIKLLVSHTTGNENTRNIIYGLYDKKLLHSFVVSIAVYKESLYYVISCFKPFSFLKKRVFPYVLKNYIVTFPFKEIGRQISVRLKLKSFVYFEDSFFSPYSESSYIDKKASKYLERNSKDIDAVYCFEDIALKTLIMAKKLHKFAIYDLPTGHWRYLRVLLDNEKNTNPDWVSSISGFKDSARKLANKDKEIELSDVIFVASTFTKKSLSLYPGKLPPVYVVPYGFPHVNDSRNYSLTEGKKIKLLYVGKLTQAKGLSYLFDSVKGLDEFYELTVVGAGDIDECYALKKALSTCNYIPPMHHDDILKLMSESDILVFPSLFDGFGLVVTEAMSQGTPVITTERTCGPDIITDGEDGWIVKAADSFAIRNLLEKLKYNKAEIIRVGKNARETARKRPWSVYHKEVVNAIIESYNLYGDATY